MISAGDGLLADTPRWTFAASCRERRELGARSGAGRGRLDMTAASWCGRCPGHVCPAARRGRFRTKAERADRQRRESPRAPRAREPDRAAQFIPDSASRQHAVDYPRRQAHGALRAPLKTLEIFVTGSWQHPGSILCGTRWPGWRLATLFRPDLRYQQCPGPDNPSSTAPGGVAWGWSWQSDRLEVIHDGVAVRPPMGDAPVKKAW
jgi:hypothetical protein